MKDTPWSITFHFVDSPEKVKSFVLSPQSKYKTPQEWEDRVNSLEDKRQVKLVAYSSMTDKEYDNYYKEHMKKYSARVLGELANKK